LATGFSCDPDAASSASQTLIGISEDMEPRTEYPDDAVESFGSSPLTSELASFFGTAYQAHTSLAGQIGDASRLLGQLSLGVTDVDQQLATRLSLTSPSGTPAPPTSATGGTVGGESVIGDTAGGAPDDTAGGSPDGTPGEVPVEVGGVRASAPDDTALGAGIPAAASPFASSEPSGGAEPEGGNEPADGGEDEELRSKLLDMESDMAEKAYEKALDHAGSQNSSQPPAQPPPGASPIGVNSPPGGNAPPTTADSPWKPGQIGSLPPHHHSRHQSHRQFDKVERKLEPISHGAQSAARHQTASAEGSGTEPAGGVSDGDENALRESR
jgi:hypothetical protein